VPLHTAGYDRSAMSLLRCGPRSATSFLRDPEELAEGQAVRKTTAEEFIAYAERVFGQGLAAQFQTW
jgi:hypothetical protein